MLAKSIVAALALVTVLPFAQAQEDTAYHRKIYAEVNGKLASLKVKTGKVKYAQRDEVETLNAKAWLDAAGVRRIEATPLKGGGGRTVDMYFSEDGKLVFVFITETLDGARKEYRHYFDKAGTKMVKAILPGGLEQPTDSHDFKDYGDELLKFAAESRRAFAK